MAARHDRSVRTSHKISPILRTSYPTVTHAMAAVACRAAVRSSVASFSSRGSRRWASSAAASCNHVAIVGTGPSGFYTAKYLVKEDPNVLVDLYDALPTPFGKNPRGGC